MTEDPRHIPVLLEETMDVLRPGPGDNILDCTVCLGGHAAAFLERTAPDGAFTGIDADGENLERARIRLAPSGGRGVLVSLRSTARSPVRPVHGVPGRFISFLVPGGRRRRGAPAVRSASSTS